MHNSSIVKKYYNGIRNDNLNLLNQNNFNNNNNRDVKNIKFPQIIDESPPSTTFKEIPPFNRNDGQANRAQNMNNLNQYLSINRINESILM